MVAVADIVRLVRAIEHHKGKHLKATLLALEEQGKLDATARKAVLDGFNNFNRSVQRLLGYTMES